MSTKRYGSPTKVSNIPSLEKKDYRQAPGERTLQLRNQTKEETILKYYKAYYLSPKQDEALKEYIRENLRKGFIRRSHSLAAYLILFILRKRNETTTCNGT